VIIVDKPPILLQKTGIEEEGATLYVRACHTGPEVPLSAAAIHTYVSMLHDSRSSFVLLLLPVHGRRRGKKKGWSKMGKHATARAVPDTICDSLFFILHKRFAGTAAAAELPFRQAAAAISLPGPTTPPP
jgi:hypothetical protein